MLNLDIWMMLVCGSIVWGALWSVMELGRLALEAGK